MAKTQQRLSKDSAKKMPIKQQIKERMVECSSCISGIHEVCQGSCKKTYCLGYINECAKCPKCCQGSCKH
jgi:hypothetical protein